MQNTLAAPELQWVISLIVFADGGGKCLWKVIQLQETEQWVPGLLSSRTILLKISLRMKCKKYANVTFAECI